MSFKKLAVLGLAGVMACGVVGTMTACGDKGGKGEDITLTLMTMFGGDDPNKPAFEKNVNAFKSENPSVKIDDKSTQVVGEGWDASVEAMFTSNNQPDVLYIFAPSRNDGIEEYLADVDAIREKHPTYAQGFPKVSGDSKTVAYLGNTFGIFYEDAAFEEEDFASYASLKTKVQSLSADKVVDPMGELNTWFNYIGLEKANDAWKSCVVPDADWFTTNRTAIEGAITELGSYLHGIGGADSKFCTIPTVDYGAEKNSMWNGNKSFDVNGNWNAGGFVKGEGLADKDTYMDYSFKNFVTTTGDIMAGFFHGWMLNKNLLEEGNEEKLAAAVRFVNAQCHGNLAYGGLNANGVVDPKITNTLQKEAMGATAGADPDKVIAPIDDKFANTAARTAMYDGLKLFMQGECTASDVIDDVLAVYEA